MAVEKGVPLCDHFLSDLNRVGYRETFRFHCFQENRPEEAVRIMDGNPVGFWFHEGGDLSPGADDILVILSIKSPGVGCFSLDGFRLVSKRDVGGLRNGSDGGRFSGSPRSYKKVDTIFV